VSSLTFPDLPQPLWNAPRPTASPASADHRRVRVHAARLSGQTDIGGKALQILLRLVTVPLSLRILGPERYGLWLAAGSLLSWFTLFDLGIGNGVVNPVSSAYANEDFAQIRRLVSSLATVSLAGAVLLFGAVLFAAYRADLATLLGVSANPALRAELVPVVVATGGALAASFALGFVNPCCLALQRGYIMGAASIGGCVLSAAALGLLALFQVRNTVAFILAASGPAVVASIAAAAFLFLGPGARIRPGGRYFNLKALGSMLSCGSPLLFTQITNLVVIQSANILISNRFGPAAVPRYAVPYSLFSTMLALCYGWLSPYWPAYAEAAGHGDVPWIRHAARQNLRRTLGLLAAGALAVIWIGRPFIRLWAGDSAVPSQPLLFAMALYFMLMACSMNFGMLLLGLGRLKTKAALGIVVTVSHILGFLLLSPLLGVAALPVAGSIGIAFEALASAAIVYRALR
jgi:O-antigen/teichoic acid export membrane protein